MIAADPLSGLRGDGLRQADSVTEVSKEKVTAQAVERWGSEEREPRVMLLISLLEGLKCLTLTSQSPMEDGHEGRRKVVRLGLPFYFFQYLPRVV